MPGTGGTVERCAAVRGISIPLPRGREPPAPLDSRGLANFPLAAAGRSRPRGKAPEESALRSVPMEDFRQSSSEPRTGGVDLAVAHGLDPLADTLVMDPGGDRNHPDSPLDGLFSASVSEAGRCAAASASRCHGALGWPALRSGGIYSHLSP